MKIAAGMLLAIAIVFGLTGCGPYKYDSPVIFGLDPYIWYHLSEGERAKVQENMTSPTEKKVNKQAFAHCLNKCIPHNNSGSTGANKKCFNHCLRKYTPVPRNYFATIPD